MLRISPINNFAKYATFSFPNKVPTNFSNSKNDTGGRITNQKYATLPNQEHDILRFCGQYTMADIHKQEIPAKSIN